MGGWGFSAEGLSIGGSRPIGVGCGVGSSGLLGGVGDLVSRL